MATGDPAPSAGPGSSSSQRIPGARPPTRQSGTGSSTTPPPIAARSAGGSATAPRRGDTTGRPSPSGPPCDSRWREIDEDCDEGLPLGWEGIEPAA